MKSRGFVLTDMIGGMGISAMIIAAGISSTSLVIKTVSRLQNVQKSIEAELGHSPAERAYEGAGASNATMAENLPDFSGSVVMCSNDRPLDERVAQRTSRCPTIDPELDQPYRFVEVNAGCRIGDDDGGGRGYQGTTTIQVQFLDQQDRTLHIETICYGRNQRTRRTGINRFVPIPSKTAKVLCNYAVNSGPGMASCNLKLFR